MSDSRSLADLEEERLFPTAAREQFWRQVVRFHLEDLNAAGDRLRLRGLSRSQRSELIAEAVGRIGKIVKAAEWNRPQFGAAVTAAISDGRAKGDDAFGPAVLLISMGLTQASGGRAFFDKMDRKTLRLAKAVAARVASADEAAQRQGRPK